MAIHIHNVPQSKPIQPTQETRDSLIRAVRSVARELNHRPTPTELRSHLGPTIDRLAGKYFRSLLELIKVATPNMSAVDMVAGLEMLAVRLRRRPSLSDIDRELNMAPSYAYRELLKDGGVELNKQLSNRVVTVLNVEQMLAEHQKVDTPHPVEDALLGFLGKQRDHFLKLPDFISYIQVYATAAIPRLWFVQNKEENQMVIPSRIVVSGECVNVSEKDDVVERIYGLRILDSQDRRTRTLPENALVLMFKYVAALKRYAITHIEGSKAERLAVAYLQACGAQLEASVEKVFSVRLLGGKLENNNLFLPDIAQYLAKYSDFGQRLFNIRSAIKVDEIMGLDGWVLVGMSDSSDQRVNGIDFVPVEQANRLLPKYFKLGVSLDEKGASAIHSVKGDYALMLAFAWLSARLNHRLTGVEKAIAIALWGARSIEEPQLWSDLCKFLRGRRALEAMWRVRNAIRSTQVAFPNQVYLLVRQDKLGGNAVYSGLSLLTGEEVRQKEIGKHTALVVLERNPSGRFVIKLAKGKHVVDVAKSLILSGKIGVAPDIVMKNKADIRLLKEAEATANSGGDVFAPDATQFEANAKRFAPQPENFGNLDEKMCKPEPLFTPADVMPVPQLDRPATAINLPKDGGFQVTDTEAAKKFATPPSDKIPVITAVSAMVVGALAFFYGGATALRVPISNPAFGGGSLFISPRDQNRFDGT